MEIDKAAASEYDFSAARAAMQRYVDQDLLAGISHAVLRGRTLVEVGCAGWADREQRIPLATEHLFRIFSSTKLVTSCAALLLWEEGRFARRPDRALPAASRPAPRCQARRHASTTPSRRAAPITIRHLMSTVPGLSRFPLDPGADLQRLRRARVRDHGIPLAGHGRRALADLPLVFTARPGNTRWPPDVLGKAWSRVLNGQAARHFLPRSASSARSLAGRHLVRGARRPGAAGWWRAISGPTHHYDEARPHAQRRYHPGATCSPSAPVGWRRAEYRNLPDVVSLVRSLRPAGPRC